MNCIVCNRPAHGVCRFCGRAICKDHFHEKNYILNFEKKDQEEAEVLTVEKALFCGKCNPIEEIVTIKLK